MAVMKKKATLTRRLSISSLAAKLLGHSRVSQAADFSASRFSLAFPAFNVLEMTYALDELVEKRLMKQKGELERATYVLTDFGRTSPISVG